MSLSIGQSIIEADMHTHTIASSHAFSTVVEMATYAQQKGLRAIAITDHGPKLPDGAHEWHFNCMRSIPRYINDVRVFRGAEANILDFDGTVDISPKNLVELDWIIASFHEPARAPGTVEDHTRAYLAIADNPYIDVIGHSGTDAFRYDYEKVLPVFKEKGKLVEINSHSFSARKGAPDNCKAIALICKKYDIPIVVNSDAHICFSLGDVKDAFRMLSSIDFPTGLIMNLEYARIENWISQKRNRK